MPATPRPARIFVSHAWADNAWCERFVELLRGAGAEVWWDVGGLRQDLIPVEVSKQIEANPVFITILTPASVERPWVETEYSAALALRNQRPEENRIIWPIVAKACHIPAILEPFRGVRGDDLTPERAAQETIRALGITPVTKRKASGRPTPTTADEAITRGKAFLEQRRPADALPLFDAALGFAEAEGNADQVGTACTGRGWSLEGLGRHDEALDAFTGATLRAPEYAQGWSGRGALLGRRGHHTDALSDLDRAVALKPDYSSAWLNRSTVLRHLGKPSEALESAERALQFDPDYGPGLMLKADALGALGRLDAAAAAYDAALAAPPAPDSPATTPTEWQVLAFANRGNNLITLNLPEAALTSYKRASALDPSYAPAWIGKGNALWRLRRYTEAVESYDQALAAGSDEDTQVAAWSSKGAALVNLEQPKAAEHAYSQALALRAGDGGSLRGLGDARRARGDYAGALDAYHASINSNRLGMTATAEVWREIGAVHIRRGEYAEALAAFDRGIAAEPFVTHCWLNESALLEGLGRSSEASAVKQRFAQHLLRQAYDEMSQAPGVSAMKLA